MKGPEAEFLDHLREGRFMLQRIASTGECVFYPRYLGEVDWRWVEASGKASVYSRTIIRRKPERGGDYCIAVVTLSEGPRMMTRVVGVPPDQVAFGMQVQASVEAADWGKLDHPVVVFRPAADEEASDGA